MVSKIRIRVDDVEVEYEGTDDFLKQELPILLDKIHALAAPRKKAKARVDDDADGNGGGNVDNGGGKGKDNIGTTSSLAADLQAKSGSDLALAAAARLTLGLGRQSFSRKDLLDEMRSASAYYAKSYSSNLTKTLNFLVKDKRFREVGKGTYSLSAETKKELEGKIGS